VGVVRPCGQSAPNCSRFQDRRANRAPTVLRLILMRSVIVWRVQVEPVRTRLVGGEGPRVGYRQGADGARLGLGPVRL